jgi:hypothetical protein
MKSHLTLLAATLFLYGCADPPPVEKPREDSVAVVQSVEPSRAEPVHEHGSHLPSQQQAAKSQSGAAIAFTDARAQTKQFIGYYRSIKLTPEQERIKVEALSALAAPCCSKFTLATCCCPCNMSKAVWGMAAWLITEKGQGVEQVRQAATDWLQFINPSGFSGEACSNGGCKRPATHDGCGGMDEADLI